MTTIFVYEHLSALGASGDPGSPLAPSLLSEGRAMLDAVRADFDSLPDVRTCIVDTASEAAFRQAAARNDFSLIIAPEFDHILETHCRWVEESQGRLLGPASRAVRLTSDKLALCDHFRAHGISTAATWQLGCEPEHFPMVWKPRDGAGSQATYLLRSPADCERVRGELAAGQAMLAQEYVEGFAASVAVLIGPLETVALAPCTQRLSTDDRFHYLGGETPLTPQLAGRATSLALQAVSVVPGLLGYVGVDLILGADATHDRIIEINPRLTTSYVGLRSLAGFNIAEFMLRIVRGERLPTLDWRTKRVAFSANRITIDNC